MSDICNIVLLVGYKYTINNLNKIISQNVGSVFVADNPYCCELLDELKQEHISTEELVDSDQLSKIGVYNYSFLDSVIEKIDKELIALENNDGLFYERGLIERYYFTCKRMLDCIHTAYKLGESLKKEHDKANVKIYAKAVSPVKYRPYDHDIYEYIYVKALRASFGIENVVINRISFAWSMTEVKIGCKKIAKKILLGLKSFINIHRLKVLSLRGRECQLFTSVGYDLQQIYPYYQENKKVESIVIDPSKLSNGFLAIAIKIFRGKSILEENVSNAIKIVNNSLSSKYSDLPGPVINTFRDAFVDILKASFKKNIMCCELGFILAKRRIINSAISSCIATSAESSFLLGVSCGGGQTFHYQHGGGQGYLDKKMSAWFNSQTDNFLCYGNVVRDHQKIRKGVNMYVTGSYRFESLKKQLSHTNHSRQYSRLKLLCVPAFPVGHRSYYPDIGRSDLFNYYLWKKILKSALSVNDELLVKYDITIKTNHFLSYKKDYFSKLKSKYDFNKINVISSGSILPHIGDGVVFLVTAPETSLLEIMLTDMPIIFYYAGGYIIEDSCKEMLRKRVYWVENDCQLKDCLKSISSDYIESMVQKNDQSFLNYNLGKTRPLPELYNILKRV